MKAVILKRRNLILRLLQECSTRTNHRVCIRRMREMGTVTTRAAFLDSGTMLLEPEQE